MSSSTPYMSRQSHMDEYGFLFVMPRLGLPDPEGEWVTIKAAIGKKADTVDIVVHPANYDTPLRRANLAQTAFVPIEHQGATWILSLVKPKSFALTAPPEFFSIKVKRVLPDTFPIPAFEELPQETDLIVLPFSVYEDQMSKEKMDKPVPRFLFSGGTVAMVQQWQHEQKREKERGEKDITEEDAINGDFIDYRWEVEIRTEAARQRVKEDPNSISTEHFEVFYRLHPAPHNDFKSLDYLVVHKDEGQTEETIDSVAEDRWKPLPPEATKPGGERQVVNVWRKKNGMKPFSQEKWPPAPARKQKRSPRGKKAKM